MTKNRTDGYGGVAIIIKDNLHSEDITQKDYTPIETIETAITWNKFKIKFISIYIKPNSNNNRIKKAFNKILADNENEPHVLIGGDVNCHNDLWEDYSTNDKNGKSIAEIITNSNSFCTLNDGTHTYCNLSRNYTSAIDITIATGPLASLASWEVGENLTSDHLAIVTKIKNPQPTPNNGRKETLNIHNLKKSIDQLETFDLNNIHNFQELNDLLTTTISNNTKQVTYTQKFKPKPWWTEEINRLWQIKNHKQRLFNIFKNPNTAIELRKSNNKLKNAIKASKKASWETYVTSIDKNCPSKVLWNKVNKIRAQPNIKSDFFDQSINMQNFLNFHFPRQSNKNIRISKINQTIDNIFEPDQLKDIIFNRKSKSPGIDGITYDLLKKLPNEYYDCLANCFNEIWRLQAFPDEWKTA